LATSTRTQRREQRSCAAVQLLRHRKAAQAIVERTLGEGVVLRVEPGGVVTVRFADDGAERRLMLEYAPLEKIA